MCRLFIARDVYRKRLFIGRALYPVTATTLFQSHKPGRLTSYTLIHAEGKDTWQVFINFVRAASQILRISSPVYGFSNT